MKLVVDANVVFSALLRDSFARALLKNPALELYAPDHLIGEIEEHLGEFAKRSGMSDGEARLFFAILTNAIHLVPSDEYAQEAVKARAAVRDRDDAPYVALALAIGGTVWSNDKGLRVQRLVPVLATHELAAALRKTSLY